MLIITPLTTIILSVIASAASAAVAVGLFDHFSRNRVCASPGTGGDDATVYLFEGRELVDATPGGEELLAIQGGEGSDWDRMIAALRTDFPGIGELLTRLDQETLVEARSHDQAMVVTATTLGGRIRISISPAASGPQRVDIDSIALRSIMKELYTLRSAMCELAIPVWISDPNGAVVWANAAYSKLAGEVSKTSGTAAFPRLFSKDTLPDPAGAEQIKRATLTDPATASQRWFECRAASIGDRTVFSAVGIDSTVAAEGQLREFMQTLTKTFSHLTTGLAVFDRQRRLTLFNPALTDLTGLPVDFLASRPGLRTVLDNLRDRNMLPEPKDYSSWRKQIASLEAATGDGNYHEVWSLPDNRTYRVTARPHPGGAVALLIEDISAEMTLTRRFRSELELGQAVIDAIDDAIVVFARDGTMSMRNEAYRTLWDGDPDDSLDVQTVTDLSRIWMARAKPTPVWREIRDCVTDARNPADWSEDVVLLDGRHLSCIVTPLSGACTMVRFQELPASSGTRREAAIRA